MKQHQKEDLKTRRDFIRQTSCAALGVTGLVNALAHLRLMTAAMAQGGTDGGYKASGVGRDLGQEAVEQCLQTKTVMVRSGA